MVKFLLKSGSWQEEYWSPESCIIEEKEDGGFVVIDQNIDVKVAIADTEDEANEWLNICPYPDDIPNYEPIGKKTKNEA